jgi:hypothetical protein
MIRSAVSGIGRVLEAMIGRLTAAGRVWAWIGVAALSVGAAMSYDFGAQVSWKHGVFLACLSFVAAFGPVAAHKVWEEGRRGIAAVVGLFAAGLLAIELGSHMSYTSGIRGHNLTETRVQNARFDGAQQQVKEAQTNLGLWTKMLADLQAQAPWAATVTAEALRSELKTFDEKIAAETAGGRGGRGKGCKAECEKLKDARNAVEMRIAATERMTDLTARIDAAKRVIADARAKADTTEHRSSPVDHANQAIARAVAFFSLGAIAPTAHVAHGTELSINMAMAVAGTGVPAFALFVAGLYRRREDEPTSMPPLSMAPASLYAAPAREPEPRTAITVIGNNDRRLDDLIMRCRELAGPQRTAA